jgi:hypothetical protein
MWFKLRSTLVIGEPLRVHGIRDAFADRLYDLGCSPFAIHRALGHNMPCRQPGGLVFFDPTEKQQKWVFDLLPCKKEDLQSALYKKLKTSPPELTDSLIWNMERLHLICFDENEQLIKAVTEKGEKIR